MINAKTQNKVKGNKGEIIAQNYLKQQKYKILCNNFSCRYGEIDIVAQQKNVLVFVEVKYRSSAKYGLGIEAVNTTKQNKIRNTAYVFLQENPQFEGFDIRFDVISILGDQIEQISGAF